MGIEKMSFNDVYEEASKMKEKIRTGDADNYTEAEKLVDPGNDLDKISIDNLVDYDLEKLEKIIPEVRAMRGFDQRSDFHSLSLDDHTKKVYEALSQDSFVSALSEKDRSLVLLAGSLHDLGKVSPAGSQIHPNDPEKRQYVGHEKESEQIVREILPRYFDLEPADIDFVARIAGLHASALNLVNNFEKNREPKGKDIKAYDKFFSEVESIPGDIDIENKMRIVFAFNKADKMGGFNDQSDKNDDKVKRIMENSNSQVAILEEMEKALPALIEAIKAKRSGNQQARIIFENGEYKYSKPEEKKKEKMPIEVKRLGGLLRNKTKEVAEVYETLKSKKDNEKVFQNMVNGMLRKKIGLSDEQIEAIIGSIK